MKELEKWLQLDDTVRTLSVGDSAIYDGLTHFQPMFHLWISQVVGFY